MNDNQLRAFIANALAEDIGEGDHTSLASIPPDRSGCARLHIKESGIIAGIRPAAEVFRMVDSTIVMEQHIDDGQVVQRGDMAFTVTGPQQSLLKAERLTLNIMQKMSGIATLTSLFVRKAEGYRARIIDTRKTTPGMRFLEKEAVKLGGGTNHRMGLYDMIMLKDNHIDFAGGIVNAIEKVREYLYRLGRHLPVVIEARTIEDVEIILDTGGIDRILLDNFTIDKTREAVLIIDGRVETESSGGITLDTVEAYAACGVDYISVGALTHHNRSLDMSMKAIS